MQHSLQLKSFVNVNLNKEFGLYHLTMIIPSSYFIIYSILKLIVEMVQVIIKYSNNENAVNTMLIRGRYHNKRPIFTWKFSFEMSCLQIKQRRAQPGSRWLCTKRDVFNLNCYSKSQYTTYYFNSRALLSNIFCIIHNPAISCGTG